MLNISTQAYVLFIMFIIISIVNLIVAGVLYGGWGVLGYLISFLFLLPLALLYIYNQDCLTAGNCNIWSWIVVIFNCLSLLISTIFYILVGTGTIEAENVGKTVKDNVKSDKKNEKK